MSARPGRITRLVEVDLPRPRGLETRESPRYFELITEVREALRGGEGPAARRRSHRWSGPRPRGHRVRCEALRRYFPALLILVAVLVGWEAVVRAPTSRRFILPAPSAIWAALVENWNDGYQIFPAARVTLIEAVGGLVIGTAAGAGRRVRGVPLPRSRDTVLPLAIAINAIPIVAFAPIANNWFGILSPFSKMAIAAALVFFPIMINVLRGLTQVDASALELMRSYAARARRGHPRRLRIPNALPYFLTGLKIATTLSLIGAVVGEYFGGLTDDAGARGGRRGQRAALRHDLVRDPGRVADRDRDVPAGGRLSSGS